MDVKFKGNSISGSVPIATTEKPGIVQVGNGLSIQDGVLSATGQEVVAGTGIEVTTQAGKATVALNSEVLGVVSGALTEEEATDKYLPKINPKAQGELDVGRFDGVNPGDVSTMAGIYLHNYASHDETPILRLENDVRGGIYITEGIEEISDGEEGPEEGGGAEEVLPDEGEGEGGVSSGGGLVRTGTGAKANSWAVILRGVYTPEDDFDAVNKTYVDTMVGSIQTALDKILNS